MDWQLLITGIQNRELSQSQIATYCGCSQATISEYATNPTPKRGPSFAVGNALVKLSKASDREIARFKSSTEAKA